MQSTCDALLALVVVPLMVGMVEAQEITVSVSAKANVFGAGRSSPPDPGGGGGGLSPVLVSVEDCDVISFPSVSGSVTWRRGGDANGPDGFVRLSDISSWDGVAGLFHGGRAMFLTGVFLDENLPADPAPARLTVTNYNGREEIRPEMHQTFFIGDGRSSNGDLQRFYPPQGATRLFLGFADAPSFVGQPGFYDDNGGSLSATVARSGCLRGRVLFEDRDTPVRVAEGPRVRVLAFEHGTLNRAAPPAMVGDDGSYVLETTHLTAGAYDLVAVFEIPEEFRGGGRFRKTVIQPFDTDVAPDFIVEVDGSVFPSEMDIIFPWPTLLVHGRVSKVSFDGQSQFEAMQVFLSQRPSEVVGANEIRKGVICCVPDLGDGDFISQYFELALDDEPALARFLALFPDGTPFHIVAYSQGGLTARLLLQQAGDGMIDLDPALVESVVQIATPNGGTCVAEGWEPSLTIAALESFNRNADEGQGVPFFLVAGERYRLRTRWNSCLGEESCECECDVNKSDTIVPVDSVFLLDTLPGYEVANRRIVCETHFSILESKDEVLVPVHAHLSGK